MVEFLSSNQAVERNVHVVLNAAQRAEKASESIILLSTKAGFTDPSSAFEARKHAA
jgi:hypothetical protein